MITSLAGDFSAVLVAEIELEVDPGHEREPEALYAVADSSDINEWTSTVEAIRAGDEEAFRHLYDLFARGIRLQLCRALGPFELDDRVHDTFLIVAQAIHRGELREPGRLMGFVRTVVRRQIAMYIDKTVQQRRENADFSATDHLQDGAISPEESMILEQHLKMMRELLRSLTGRDGEILKRFYLHGASPEEICSDLGITINQFRLIKSRAKARFSEVSRRRILNRSLRKISQISLQTFTSRGH